MITAAPSFRAQTFLVCDVNPCSGALRDLILIPSPLTEESMRVKSFAVIMLAAAASCSDDGSEPVTQTEGGVPGNVRAVITGNTVQLSWNAVEGAVAYNVYMAEVGGVKRVNVATLPGNMTHSHNTTAFDHPSGLAAALRYYFVVTAVKAGNTESPESCEVTAKIATNEGGSCQ
jgi:hypothetical protein